MDFNANFTNNICNVWARVYLWVCVGFFFRVVAQGEVKEVSGFTFTGYGSHSDEYPVTYLTVAAAIGMTKEEVDTLIKRLDKVMEKWKSCKNSSSVSSNETASTHSRRSHDKDSEKSQKSKSAEK